jgi:hypothetical protein
MLTGGVKRVLMIAVCMSVAALASGQSTVLEKVWTTSCSAEGYQEINTRVDRLVSEVGQRHYRGEIRKLHDLFKKTHARFLHSYVRYTGIEGLAKGRYDCLTATSLFADILAKSGYEYNIIETNYHIFIVVNTTDGDVVLETTDRFGGFIDDERKKNEMIAEYKKNVLTWATPSHLQYNFRLYQPVNTDQLAGLLYFNQAVNAFNNHKWLECSDKLSASSGTTSYARVAQLAAVLCQSITVSNDIDEETKTAIMNRWKGVALHGMPVASR